MECLLAMVFDDMRMQLPFRSWDGSMKKETNAHFIPPPLKPCPVNERGLSYIMLPHDNILVKTTDSWRYMGSTIGGESVAKPPLSLLLYNSKTQGFS